MRIKEIREAAGLTRIQVADRLGVTVGCPPWPTCWAVPSTPSMAGTGLQRFWTPADPHIQFTPMRRR